jgi:DNA-binding NtrC family response regulator
MNELIYIVDDSKTNLKIINKMIHEKIGCTTREFNSADECWYWIENNKEKPVIILSDYYLDVSYSNKLNGDQFLTRVKKKYPNISMVLFSSLKSIQRGNDFINEGAASFIPRDDDFLENLSIEMKLQFDKIFKKRKQQRIGILMFLGWVVFIGTMYLLR